MLMSLRDKRHQKKAFLSTGWSIANKQYVARKGETASHGQIADRRAGVATGAAVKSVSGERRNSIS
jgi:hypothetical protein